MSHCTALSQALTDRLSTQANARASRYRAAQDAARLQTEQAAHVLRTRTFARAEDLCRLTPAGIVTQAAMTISGAGESATVVCSIDEAGSTLWFLTDASRLSFPAAVYIRAVQNRLADNHARRDPVN